VQRVLAIVGFFGLLSVFLRLGARGPLVSTSLSLILCLLLQVRIGRSRRRSGTRLKSVQLCAFLVLLLSVGSVFGYVNYTGKVPRTIQRLNLLFDGGRGYAFGRSAGVRVEYYYSAYLIWFDQPAYGGGIGSYPVKLGMADARNYPHNLFLEIMAELGTVGLFLFLAMLIAAFRNLGSWRTIQNDPLRVIALMFVVSSLAGTMFSGDLVDNRTVFGTIGFLGLAPAFRESRRAAVASVRGSAVS
ncbi:MAG: O-antigen ligase family protein, partial [Planctomycetaceae bacterium]